ncbi:MAG: Ig-like domain repeat protein, partial [Gaiellaceae bacterium]
MRRIRRDSNGKGGKRARRAAIVFAFMALFAAGAVASGALGMTSVGGGPTDSTSTSAESAPSDDGSPTSTETTTTDPTTTTDATTASTTTDAATTAAAPIAPEISSDKPDYNPGATVLLTSHGWHPGEAVHVSVNDDVGQTWAHDVDVTADAAGDFTDQFSLPDWFVADYNVRAIGSSGAVAATTFSDSAVQAVTVAVSPTTAAVNAVYTVKFTPTNSVPVGDFIQIVFPSGTTLPATIAAGNITVNGTAAPAASFLINISQRQLQFDSPVALAANVQATVVIGATAAAIGNPPAATYTLQLKTKDDNNQAASAPYTIVATKSTSTALTSSANPSTYPALVTLTATVTATPTPNPNGAGTVTFKDGAATLCNAVALSGNTATCTPSPALGAGAHSLTADYSGAAGFAASSGALTQTVSKGSQTITVTTHAPASAAYNSSFSVAASASSGLAVSFSSAGGCTNSGATFTMTSGATSCTVRYDQAGDANYNPATQVSESVNASKANQAITVTTHAPSSAAFNANFTVAATGGGSGNPVTFSSAGGCTNSGAAFTMTSGATACSVKYDQAGDANYNAASQVTETVSATKAGQAIAFTSTAPSNAVFGDVYQPTATGGASGNPVIFGASGACSYNGGTGTVSMISAGTCTVTADQLGNANYNAAPQASQVFSVAKASQTIAFAALADKTFGDADFTVAATASSGLAVSFAASGDCSLSGSSVHLTGAGGCTIVASQGGNSSYSAAPDVARSFSIGKGTQSIVFAPLAAKTFGDAGFSVAATASSGL